jgi:hypothetical protein
VAAGRNGQTSAPGEKAWSKLTRVKPAVAGARLAVEKLSILKKVRATNPDLPFVEKD